MARIFTIYFDHENDTYNAMVRVREAARHTEFLLKVQDDGLQRQLPSDRLIATESGDLKFVAGAFQQPTQLMRNIKDAVVKYLKQLSL